MTETRSTCPYCGVGCGLLIQHDGERIHAVRGDPDHPANFGRLCIKGATLDLTATPATHAVRALRPELRVVRTAPRQRVSWDTALDTAAERFAGIIREHGPQAVAFYGSGQWLTEDYYVFNKLVKGLIGTNNLDTNSRLCMSSAVTGYKATLGMDAPPCAYEDIGLADCLFIAGANPAFAHPVLFRRVEDARKANPALKIVVVDPRRTDSADIADLHLPLLPGTDIALFNAMLHVMLWEGWIREDWIAAHTEGFDALRKLVRDYTPAHAASVCGLRREDIEQAAEWFATSAATLSLYCQGLNQSSHGTWNNAALINLHLATGHIGRPGAGPFSLTGQPNAMGGREAGGMANLLSAHRDLAKPEDRAAVAALWGLQDVPSQPGKTAVELFEAVRRGEIKALWIACTNPAQSLPDQGVVHEALQAAEFVVVQEAFRTTETAAYADLLLPASTWGEKHGTVTNSERRITRVLPALPPPAEARHDWQIGIDFAHRLGERLGKGELARRLFPYTDPESIWNEHRESTRGQDLDITGLSYALLEREGPQQWPYPEGAKAGTVRLYADGRFPTPSGRARFVPTEHRDTADKVSARYPLHLLTGRLRDQWHGMSRTGIVPRLYAHESEPLLHMNAADLARRDLREGDLVTVSSARGSLGIRVTASEAVRPGQCFLPMHWGANSMAGLGSNTLTVSTFDPTSKQPELKHAAVQVKRLEAGAEVVLLRTANDAEALGIQDRLRSHLDAFSAASLTLAGRDATVVQLRGRLKPEAGADLEALDRDAGLADPTRQLSYEDRRKGISKRALVAEGCLEGVRLAGETQAADWLRDTMVRRKPADALRKWLLAPLTQPPEGTVARGKVVCNCFDVAENEITAAFAAGESLVLLQTRTKCGTNCGSCLPELRRLASSVKATSG